ncbi:MAG: hypothetical protein GY874_11790 [Desulfobacteraceae bacterium]|nr:hypothetical protein [Desulfobacteraceae bacterium]
MVELTDIKEELVLDQIKEIFNLGLGSASREIGELFDQEITLDVPTAKITKAGNIPSLTQTSESDNITAILQEFSGTIMGETLLIFRDEKSLEFVRHLLNEESSFEQMTEMDEEVLSDISSIIVNHILMAISGTLSITLSSSIPICIHGKLSHILNLVLGKNKDEGDNLLFVTICFEAKQKGIHGKLVFLQDLQKAKTLFAHIREYISDVLI